MNPSTPLQAPTTAPVVFSDEAVAAALDLQQKTTEYQGPQVRIYIDGKGCDGFYYGVTFDKKDPTDISFSQNGLELVVDPETLKYLNGSIVNWVDDERATGFLVSNPSHKKFKGKFFKRENWQQRVS